jgi:hypothetical protein
MHILKPLFVAFVIAAMSLAPAAGAEWGTQKNSQGAVTVAVTPVELSAGAKTWDFKVVLDTHSQTLNDDLIKAVALIDDRGARHAPVAWDGAAPGGHHREGVLRFKPIAPRPQSIELQLRRPNEPAARTFRWALQ